MKNMKSEVTTVFKLAFWSLLTLAGLYLYSISVMSGVFFFIALIPIATWKQLLHHRKDSLLFAGSMLSVSFILFGV